MAIFSDDSLTAQAQDPYRKRVPKDKNANRVLLVSAFIIDIVSSA